MIIKIDLCDFTWPIISGLYSCMGQHYDHACVKHTVVNAGSSSVVQHEGPHECFCGEQREVGNSDSNN